MRWTILTGEYPPQPGGVSDYTYSVASHLAASADEVHVWAPRRECDAGPGPEQVGGAPCGGPAIHPVPDEFGPRTLARLAAEVERVRCGMGPLLIQYSPPAFGYKAMNLPFCLWVVAQSRRMPVWVMFHEVAFPVARSQPLRHNVLGRVSRLMARLLARSASRIFVSVPAWADLLREIDPKIGPVTWLPVPSNMPTTVDDGTVAAIRSRYSGNGGSALLGHFGTFGGFITRLLDDILPVVLGTNHQRRVLLVGRGSASYRAALVDTRPELCGRLHAVEGLSGQGVADHLAACDLLVQPYPDGVSSRRTTAMAGLALGVPVVTNRGGLTEAIWGASGAVALAGSASASAFDHVVCTLLRNDDRRRELGLRARALYADRFSVERAVDTLRLTAWRETN